MPSDAAPVLQSNVLLQLHLAEYHALMERCTYFIVLHVGIWAVVVSILGTVVAMRADAHFAVILWSSGAAIQAVLHIWVTLIEEQYRTVFYIENELRRCIVRAAPDVKLNAFWRYESSLKRRRPRESWWGEWIAPMLVTCSVLLLAYLRRETLLAELPWLLLNSGLAIAFALRTSWRMELRRSFSNTLEKVFAPDATGSRDEGGDAP